MKVNQLLNTNPNESVKNTSRKKKNLTDREREYIYSILEFSNNGGKPRKGMFLNVASQFNVQPRTISRIWQRGQRCAKKGLPSDVTSKIKHKSGRKKQVYNVSMICVTYVDSANKLSTYKDQL